MTNAQRRRAAREAREAANRAGTRKHDPEGWLAAQRRIYAAHTARAELNAILRPGRPGYLNPALQGRPAWEGRGRARRRRAAARARASS